MSSDAVTIPDSFPADQQSFIPHDPEKEWANLRDWVVDNIPNVDVDEWLAKFNDIREEHQRNLDEYLAKTGDGLKILGAEDKHAEQQREAPDDDSAK